MAQLLTIEDVANRLKLSKAKVYRLAQKDPEFRSLKIKIGSATRFDERDIDAWAQRQKAA